jgi:hypothetical protein
MKRKLFILFFLLLLLMVSSSDVFAKNPDIYITDGTQSGGKYVDRTDTVFKLNETPYVYVKASPSITFASGLWNAPGWGIYFTDFGPSSEKETLMTLNWGDGFGKAEKTPGLWSVDSLVLYGFCKSEFEKNHFSFAPEPVSSSLFLLGAGVMLAKRFRKRRC